MTTNLPPKLHKLPNDLPIEGAIRLESVEGVIIFRASTHIQNRIETLLNKQKDSFLTAEEEKELDQYEELNDYLTWVNHITRNAFLYPLRGTVYRYDDPFEPPVPLEDWEALQ